MAKEKTKSFRGVLCALSIVGISVAGCSTLPTNGPSSGDIKAQQISYDSLPYAVVKVTADVSEVLSSNTGRLTNAFADRRPPQEIKFGIGDIVSVTIFEASAGGLFIPLEAGVRPGNFIALPNQPVDSKGNISVPYAGAIRAKGRTPSQVQQSIADVLKNRAIEPQAVVALVDQRTSMISVLGEVNAPSRFPANAAGEHILDAIARAGGPRAQGYDIWVQLERGGRQARIPFGALVYEPSNNIYVHPQDTIYLYREPQTFVAFGASGQQGQFSFDAWRLSVSEAIARAGGLNDAAADPASVFVYRGETREIAKRLGVDLTRFNGPIVPVIYNFNLRDPSAYFLASQMTMRNKDVLFVSNATTVEFAKFLNFIRLITATVNDPIVAAYNGASLQRLVKP